jgi:hypothetical protein
MTILPQTTLRSQVAVDPLYLPFAAHLHRRGAKAHYWTKQNASSVWYWMPHEQEPLNAYLLRYDCYYTVNPCGPDTRMAAKHKSSNEDVTAVNCLYADFDAKDFPGGLEAIFGHVTSLPWRPSAAVASGGGLHCYWLAAAPWLCSEPDEREAVATLQESWVHLVGADTTVHDLCRILRIPGSQNFKYDPPRPVSFVWCDLDRLYEWGDLVTATAGIQPTIAEQRRQREQVVFEHSSGGSLADTDADRIELAKTFDFTGAKFSQLWAGNIDAYGGDDSKADMALAALLAFVLDRDPGRVTNAMYASGLKRDKWEHKSYLATTVKRACDSVRTAYVPPDPERQAAIEATKELAAGAVRGAQ